MALFGIYYKQFFKSILQYFVYFTCKQSLLFDIDIKINVWSIISRKKKFYSFAIHWIFGCNPSGKATLSEKGNFYFSHEKLKRLIQGFSLIPIACFFIEYFNYTFYIIHFFLFNCLLFNNKKYYLKYQTCLFHVLFLLWNYLVVKGFRLLLITHIFKIFFHNGNLIFIISNTFYFIIARIEKKNWNIWIIFANVNGLM